MKTIVAAVMIVLLQGSRVWAQTVNLVPMVEKREADSPQEATLDQLKDIERARRFIIEFVAKADAQKKYSMTSEGYRGGGRTPDTLRRAFDKESYSRIDFLRFDFAQGGNTSELAVKADLHWSQEGYQGTQTFYFILIKAKGRWVVHRLMY